MYYFNKVSVSDTTLGLYSLNCQTHDYQISWSLKAMRLDL